MVECPVCGSEISEAYLTNHIKKMHPDDWDFGHSCDICDEGFRSEPAVNSHMGQAHPNTTRQSVKCEACETKIIRQSHQLEKYDYFFCSDACKSKHYQTLTGEDAFRYDGSSVSLQCKWCEDEFQVASNRKDTGKFCGMECYAKWRSEFVIGEDHPRWSGGRASYYGPHWQQKRQQRLEIDNYECKICGITEQAHIEDEGRSLDIHHIKPIASFKDGDSFDYKSANSMNNLVTLCQECHIKWEGIPVMPK